MERNRAYKCCTLWKSDKESFKERQDSVESYVDDKSNEIKANL